MKARIWGMRALEETTELFLRVWGQVVEHMGPRFEIGASEDSYKLHRSFSRLKLLRDLRNGPLTMSETANRLGVSNAAVTGMADRLEAKGLIKRVQATADRRVVCLELTPQGYALQRDNHLRAVDWTQGILSQLNPDELETFKGLMTKIQAGIIRGAEKYEIAKAS